MASLVMPGNVIGLISKMGERHFVQAGNTHPVESLQDVPVVVQYAQDAGFRELPSLIAAPVVPVVLA